MRTLLRDLKHGFRRIRSDRAVSAAVVLTLTIAIGSCTAIFSVVNGVLDDLATAQIKPALIVSARPREPLIPNLA